jgi:hypothetical protein
MPLIKGKEMTMKLSNLACQLLVGVVLVLGLAHLINQAHAETLEWNATINNSCTFGSTAPGILQVNANTISHLSFATVSVNTNVADIYTLTLDPVTSLSVAPVGQTITGPLSMTMATLGSNSSATTTGDAASGYEKPLSLITSNETVQVGFNGGGLLVVPNAPGTYKVEAVISCVAL